MHYAEGKCPYSSRLSHAHVSNFEAADGAAVRAVLQGSKSDAHLGFISLMEAFNAVASRIHPR